MGWKLSSIIIKTNIPINQEELLEEIGFTNLKMAESEPYEAAMYPLNDQIFIGAYKENLIISADTLPVEFFTKSLSPLEEKLIALFPQSEICAISLHSTTNHWGYAVIKNGKKIRARAGDYDNGTILDFGEPLEEEIDLLSKSRLDQDGNRIYYLQSDAEDFYSEDQVGENFVFNLFKRYTGVQLDQDDDFLFTSEFQGYQISLTDNSIPLDTYFSCDWDGCYIYGDGYNESIKGKKVNFLLSMQVNDREITGTRIEKTEMEDERPAVINGLLLYPFINFQVQYAAHYSFDKNNEIKKDTKRPSLTIVYTGLFDIFTKSFKGVWNIEETKCWGEWTMKKK